MEGAVGNFVRQKQNKHKKIRNPASFIQLPSVEAEMKIYTWLAYIMHALV
jgi:hypothetical protein